MSRQDEKRSQTDELTALFQGMNREDREALLRYARVRAAKYRAQMGGAAVAPVPGRLGLLQRRNVGGVVLFDSFRCEIQ